MLFPFWSRALGLSRDAQVGAALQDVPVAVAGPGWVLLPAAAQGWGSCRDVREPSTPKFFIKTTWTKKGLIILETLQTCGAALAALSLIAGLGLPQGSLTFFTSAISIRIFCWADGKCPPSLAPNPLLFLWSQTFPFFFPSAGWSSDFNIFHSDWGGREWGHSQRMIWNLGQFFLKQKDSTLIHTLNWIRILPVAQSTA